MYSFNIMCSAIITKNKPQKGRELLHSLPLLFCAERSEDLGQLGPNVPFGEHASPLLDPAEDFVADLADLLGGDGIGDRLQVKLPLVIDDRVEIEADPIAEIILQCSLGDVGIPQLGVEAQDEDQTVLQGFRHVVLLDEGEAAAALHEAGAIHLAILIDKMPGAIFVITIIGDVEFDLYSFLIEDWSTAHSPSELDFLTRIEDPPESRFLVFPPVEGLLLIFDFSVLLCHFDTPF